MPLENTCRKKSLNDSFNPWSHNLIHRSELAIFNMIRMSSLENDCMLLLAIPLATSSCAHQMTICMFRITKRSSGCTWIMRIPMLHSVGLMPMRERNMVTLHRWGSACRRTTVAPTSTTQVGITWRESLSGNDATNGASTVLRRLVVYILDNSHTTYHCPPSNTTNRSGESCLRPGQTAADGTAPAHHRASGDC